MSRRTTSPSKLAANFKQLGKDYGATEFEDCFPDNSPSPHLGAYGGRASLDAGQKEWFAQIESRLREADAGDEGESAPEHLASQLMKWMEKHLCSGGFLLGNPTATASLLLPLDRLRTILHESGWSDGHEDRFRRVFNAVLRLIHSGGNLFTGAPFPKIFVNRLNQLCKEKEFSEWAPVCAMAFEEAAGRKTKTAPPTPGHESDASSIAIMRRDWARDAEVVAVQSPGAEFDLLVKLMGLPIFAGDWETEVLAAGKPIPSLGQWETTCWYTDTDGEYCEYRRLLGSGLAVERQIYLARATEFLWMSDTIKSPLDEELEVVWRIPTPNSGSIVGNLATTAKQIVLPQGELRVIPATSSADLLGPVTSRLELKDGKLIAKGSRKGNRLFMGYAFTWDRERLPDQVAWKRVTVTSDREVMSDDQAVAIRIPIKGRQIVGYRRFVPLVTAAFVGYHTTDETVFGAFEPSRFMREWVTVR